jgi:hypothetical protein
MGGLEDAMTRKLALCFTFGAAALGGEERGAAAILPAAARP